MNKSFTNFRKVGNLEEKLDRLGEIFAGLLNGVPLAGNIQLWTERDVALPLLFNHGGELLDLFHI